MAGLARLLGMCHKMVRHYAAGNRRFSDTDGSGIVRLAVIDPELQAYLQTSCEITGTAAPVTGCQPIGCGAVLNDRTAPRGGKEGTLKTTLVVTGTCLGMH